MYLLYTDLWSVICIPLLGGYAYVGYFEYVVTLVQLATETIIYL